MKLRRNQLVYVLAAPLVSAALLGAIAIENSTHLTPTDVEPYHQRIHTLIGNVQPDGSFIGGTIPYTIGNWVGRDEAVPEAAQKLLKPNAIFSRLYRDVSTDGMARNRVASLLIVQCRDTRDMRGHYPPVCYPAHGQVEVSRKEKTWDLPGNLRVPGTQYEFAQNNGGDTTQRIVYNFMILPGHEGEIVPDIKGVNRVSEDYQQRYYGAAQFQLVMPATLSEPERDQIFRELVGANASVIKQLRTTSR